VYFVLNMERNELYGRINSRVDKLFEEGLVEEVITLKGEGLTDNDVSMQGLGYKETLRALDGEYTIEEAREKIKEETRHFAKRQLTWFKREKNITWIDVSGDVDPVGIMTSVVSQHFI
ncbi:MAG: tRNA dimethylallyltransferase, partial [Lachnospiraceae bacterium]|nr:tRNA dimethylallyltransferase [Lachnospiraceae bacterium]